MREDIFNRVSVEGCGTVAGRSGVRPVIVGDRGRQPVKGNRHPQPQPKVEPGLSLIEQHAADRRKARHRERMADPAYVERRRAYAREHYCKQCAKTVAEHERPNPEVAYCPDTPEFNPCLTAIQTLEEAASLHGKRNVLKENLSDVIVKVGLQKYNSTYVGNFSRGMKQRLGIAVALILQPDILFLDEPTSALDPFGREAVLELISDIGSNIPVVFSSHALDDVQRIADELLVLDKGSLLYSGTLERFLSKNGDLSIIRVVSSRASEKITKILGVNGIKSVFLSQDKLCISIESTAYKKAWGVLGDVSDLIVGFDRYSISLWTAFSAAIQDYEKTGRCHG